MIQDSLVHDMNEHIEPLAKEALRELHTDKDGALLLTPVFEKFAELLINKCKEAVAKTDPTTSQRATQAINDELGIK